MTLSRNSVIVIQERKADLEVQGKEGSQMKTTMIFANLEQKQHEAALKSRQGFVFSYTFFDERDHMIPEISGINLGL